MRGTGGSDRQRRIADVQLQNLALDLNGPNQDPDLLGGEPLGVGFGEVFKLFHHRRVLVGRSLQTQVHFFPGLGQLVVVRQPLDIFRRVGQQQAEPSDITHVGLGTKRLDAASKFLTVHGIGQGSDCGKQILLELYVRIEKW